MEVKLSKKFFGGKERLFLANGGVRASLFTYDTGVHAVKLENEAGHAVVLPFKGQQVWDAVFRGRCLTMATPFPEPRNVQAFIDTYGCFMMHCGALRMGCPGSGDDHPLHGELPYADYDEASVVAGEDEKGSYVGVTGLYRYRKAFGEVYDARPTVKVRPAGSLLDISIEIENRSEYPMDLMYMCHVNFRPVTSGRIVQSADWSEENMRLRADFPAHVKVSPSLKGLLGKLKAQPEITDTIRPEYEFNPEVVYFLQRMRSDKNGNAHFLQLHPDGSADYVTFNAAELDHTTRWIVLTKNQRALGIALPATAEPEGFQTEKKKGYVRRLEGKASARFSVTAGCVDRDEAKRIEKVISSLG
jgi:hypothetical protein